MEFEGTVIRLLPPVSGVSARGEWKKQEVIVEQKGEYGRKICVSFWGDKADDASHLSEGEEVSVAANVESREYNGRWFTEVRAWKLTRMGTAPAAEVPGPPLEVSEPAGWESSSESFDDLPF